MTADKGDRFTTPVTVAALVFVASVGIVLSLKKSVGWDEAYTLDTTAHSVGYAFQRARDFELQPPLYFLLATIWRMVSHSVAWLRLLSTLSAVGSVWMIGRIAGLLGVRPSWKAVWIAAACPALLWATTEARVYALVALLISVSLYWFTRLCITGTATPRRDAALLVGFAYLALLTQYYAGFVLAAAFVAGLLFGTDRRRLVICGVVLALLCLPWVPTILHQAETHPQYRLLPDFASASWYGSVGKGAVWSVTEFFKAFLMTAALGRPVVNLVLAGGLVLLGIVVLRRREIRWNAADSIFALVSVVPMIVLLVLTATGAVLVLWRHWMVTLPGTLVWLTLLISGARAGRERWIAHAMVGGFLVVACGRFVLTYQGQVDWKSAAGFIASHEAEGDVVLSYLHTLSTPPIVFDYHGSARVVPLIYDADPEHPDVQVLEPDSREALRRELAQYQGGTAGIWAVSPPTITMEAVLKDFSQAAGSLPRVTVDTAFTGVQVYRLQF